ncbi:MAG TPA: SHOCT domain-containing protein [Nocardioides sp.]|uniref:SHOCT domain-containing protein n=1 Tax=uncultured Nocardioides sp. TaxID=198441 RepID=UPI00262FF8BC|nr:SHOCT domain-containing protein [uncultured Nocardioides sp.]HRI97815.1 SHOCT domain-containing protein [Nocardioides sp.]HRK47206.1 SHOCT domain-containing protein [Nocardioides sp.]
MSFWDIIWFIIVSFAFIAYLLILFNIIGDLFRDHETSGWLKAVWVIFLLFFPFLTALVYLIARGKGMAERSAASMASMKAQQDEYIRSVTAASGGGTSSADEIAKAQSLLDAGTITQAEFDALKAKALA